ncbi:tetratricopeptide repeat protein [Janthinobacterium lividum]|uniref:tetratricopeptide repeat protein n=1 Tax=Janthinobacterium lividum TaxID=29581 RepID=UPI0009C116FB|nr:tetratricopeptide repeat protein [Janthinobacterium lividum]
MRANNSSPIGRRSESAVDKNQQAQSALHQDAVAQCKLAERLSAAGRHEEAILAYDAALLLQADEPSIHNDLGNALQKAGRLDEALDAYRHMLLLSPQNALAESNIGSVLQAQGEIELAMQRYQVALAIAPDFAAAHFNLGTCKLLLEKVDESLVHFSAAIRCDPSFYLAHNNLTTTLSRAGRIDEATEACRHALAINPQWNEMHSNLLFSLTHNAAITPARLFEEHLHFGRQFEAPLQSAWPQHANKRDPDRVLRVGFVSADLNNHAMANFITPVLEHLMHATRLEIHVYCNNRVDDHTTAYLKGVVRRWQAIQALSDQQLAEQIAKDGIDILIDLSGHTGSNRLLAFARKPAPIQMTWMGYPMTTGLQAMDYYLTDRYFSPPGLLDEQFTEKLLALPACAPYVPSPEAPEIAAAPALAHGHLTFGSFNRANKLSREVIAGWSALLRVIPQARMVLGAMPSEQFRNMLLGWFAEEGITAERLNFHDITSTSDYLALHRLVDVCLDTWPYNGGTTTLHALWMGVPTLTMAGKTLQSRVGATILGHLGLTQFIAQDLSDLIQKGQELANDLDALVKLRMSMRTRLANSAAGQPALIAAGLDSALRTAWQRWCAGLPAVPFEADPSQSSLAKRAASLQALYSVNVDAALLLAIEHHQASRFAEAETLYLAIIHRQPQHAIAHHNLGLLATQLGYHDKSLPHLRAATLARPDEMQFVLSYAQALLHAGQADTAVDVITQAIARGIKGADLQPILSKARQAAADESPAPTQLETEHIVRLYQTGHLVDMEDAVRLLIGRYPDSGFAWSALGTALRAQGKDALAVLQRAVQLSPADAQAHGNLGNSCQDAGDYRAAIECYRRALELEPTLAEASANMGSAQYATGDTVGAIDSFRQAVLLDPDDALAHANLGNILAAMNDFDGAVTHYRQALALVPDDPQLHHDLGQVLQAMGCIEEAYASFSRAQALAQGHPNPDC